MEHFCGPGLKGGVRYFLHKGKYVRVNTNLTPVLGYLLPREDKIFNRDYAPSYSVPECRDWMEL